MINIVKKLKGTREERMRTLFLFIDKKTRALLLFLLSLMGLSLVFSACVPKTGEDAVEVETSGIFEPVTFTIVGGTDLGEILTGSDPIIKTIEVKNNSKFDITQLQLTLYDTDASAAGMSLTVGEGMVLPAFPGFGGTCKASRLAAGQSCTIRISYNPARSGTFKQMMTFKYRNFVDASQLDAEITMVTGEPASLVFPDEKSVYNYGILEQTEPVVKDQVLTIENRGGLSARNVDLAVTANTNPSAFTIKENGCPNRIKPNERCQVIVSYVPLNNQETDPAVDYTAQLNFSYIKDGKAATGNLNSFYSFKSTKIQGVFESNQVYHTFTPDITVGNKESRNIKVINKGYKEGVLLEIILKDSLGATMGVCKNPVVGGYLSCFAADGTTPITWATMPFRLKDVSACMNVEVPGIRGDVSGESCVFELTFWPSVSYLVNRDFTGTKLEFKYDSRWKNLVTLIFDQLFVVDATSLAAGNMIMEYFRFGGVNLTNQSADPLYGFYDVGRQALITNAIYKTAMSARFKNAGFSQVEVISITDRQSPVQNITGSPTTIMSQTDPAFPTCYNLTSSNCVSLAANEFCDLVSQFTPLFYANEPLQDRLMFDEDPNGFQGANRYKEFIVNYTDSTTFEDSGSARPVRQLKTRMTGLLVTKGMLVFQNTSPVAGDLGSWYTGNVRTHDVILQNVGTGTIPYVKVDDVKHLMNPCGSCNWLFNPQANPPPSGVTKDCFPITDFMNNQRNNPFPPPGDLAPGETCSYHVEAKVPLRAATSNVWNFSPDDDRHYQYIAAWDNTYDQWMPGAPMADSYVSFQYYDGDGGLGALGSGYDNFLGFFKTMTDYNVKIDYNGLARIGADDPLPMESAVLYRPQINFPSFNDGPYTINADTEPAKWFTWASATAPAASQVLSPTHVGGLVSAADDLTFHAGTFPANGETHTFGFTVKTLEFSTNARIDSISLSSVIPQISIATGMPGSFPFNAGYPYDIPLTFNFSPGVAAGTYETILNVNFFDRYRNVNLSIRIIAEAKDSTQYPPLTMTSEDYNVTFTPPATTNEVLSGTQNAVSLRTNTFDAGYSSVFTAVKGSAVYAKKKYRITNTGAMAVNGLVVMVKQTLSALTYSNSAGGYSVENLEPACTNLAAGATCSFDIKFLASVGASAMTRYVLLHYPIQNNQWISRVFRVQFDALDPANLTVVGNTKMAVSGGTGFGDPEGTGSGSGWIYQSYPIYYGTFVSTPHIQQVAYPTVGSKNLIQVSNAALLKASFLKQIEPAAVPAFPANNILIYNQNNRKVYATRGCFYGDDEFNGAVPAAQKGFNSNTTAVNYCYLQIDIETYEQYTGADINPSDNIVILKYYNNERASYDWLYFHLNGFVESNYSTHSASYSNVQATLAGSNGTISFNWGAFTPNNAVWGDVTGYRVYYRTTASALSNVHILGSPFVDTAAGTTNVSISSLVAGRYYYFKVVAKRTKNAKTYISESTTLPVLKVVVPLAGSRYVRSLAADGALVDDSLSAGFGFKAAALAACAAKKYNLTNGGSAANITKQLITTSVWNWIKSDPDQVTFATYSTYVAPATSHWLSDAATNIAPIFAPYGFDSSATTQYVPGPELLYQKPCADSSCNVLDKVVGGDGSELPYNATLYIKADQAAAAYRCWAPI